MRSDRYVVSLALILALTGGTRLAAQELPLAPVRTSGQGVTPAFEGWYQNPDGTFSLSFGYFNRNSEEVLEVPVGPDNFIEPGNANQGQPTRFHPRRHWGVFTVTVPADFGRKRIVWTLKVRGETFSIPGGLKRDWQIDAVGGEVGSGNTPPVLRFDSAGGGGSGPGGTTVGRLASVGKPLTITVWATDDGRASGNVVVAGRDAVPVTLTWFKHQGPGDATFAPPTARIPPAGGSASTTVMFTEPGDYVLRVRANDASGVVSGGHAQCCWTNGFVKVTVTR